MAIDMTQRAIMEAKEAMRYCFSAEDWTIRDLGALTQGVQFHTSSVSGISSRAKAVLDTILSDIEGIAVRNDLDYDAEVKFYNAIEVYANTVNTRLSDLLKNI